MNASIFYGPTLAKGPKKNPPNFGGFFFGPLDKKVTPFGVFFYGPPCIFLYWFGFGEYQRNRWCVCVCACVCVCVKRKLDAYPKPSFLKEKGDGKINVAVTGQSGVGKSTFINTIRGLKPKDPNAAKCDVAEVIADPAPYSFPDIEEILLWDLPGTGTPTYPLDTYISRMGLRYFDAVIIVGAGRFHAGDLCLMKELKKHGVPFYYVRNKVNSDVRNMEEDYDVPVEKAIKKIARDLKKNGVEAPYLVNAKNLKQFDGPKLVRDIENTIAKDRATK